MKIKLHGGDCCGVKHIHGLCSYPNEWTMPAREKIEPITGATSFGNSTFGSRNDMRHANTKQDEDFFNEEAPKETYAKRFVRMVNFIKKHRPHGIIEVVLTSNQKKWVPILRRHGFKKVASARNSNTLSTLSVHICEY